MVQSYDNLDDHDKYIGARSEEWKQLSLSIDPQIPMWPMRLIFWKSGSSEVAVLGACRIREAVNFQIVPCECRVMINLLEELVQRF